MAVDENEEQALGIGFDPALARQYRKERLARPKQWSPGVRIQSSEEYNHYTNQLARQLLKTLTLEQMAVITAQHMIFADELKFVLEENEADMGTAYQAIFAAVIQAAREAVLIGTKAKDRQSVEKRAAGVRKNKAGVKAYARELASKKWDKDSQQKIKIGKMAQTVYDELRKSSYSKLVVSVGAVRIWIAPCAPTYAKKPGPQK